MASPYAKKEKRTFSYVYFLVLVNSRNIKAASHSTYLGRDLLGFLDLDSPPVVDHDADAAHKVPGVGGGGQINTTPLPPPRSIPLDKNQRTKEPNANTQNTQSHKHANTQTRKHS